MRTIKIARKWTLTQTELDNGNTKEITFTDYQELRQYLGIKLETDLWNEITLDLFCFGRKELIDNKTNTYYLIEVFIKE